jgi:hypothetical protein
MLIDKIRYISIVEPLLYDKKNKKKKEDVRTCSFIIFKKKENPPLLLPIKDIEEKKVLPFIVCLGGMLHKSNFPLLLLHQKHMR